MQSFKASLYAPNLQGQVAEWVCVSQNIQLLTQLLLNLLTNHGATQTFLIFQVSFAWIRCPIKFGFKLHQRPTVLVREESNYKYFERRKQQQQGGVESTV